jgi:predicted nucleic acid-binding protein
MADSIILATAREHRATVWTLDEDFSGLSDVRYFAKK